MDAFRILSRGASLKTSKKSSAGFSAPAPPAARSVAADVERETDFFKTRAHGPKDPEPKKAESDDEHVEPVIQTAEQAGALRRRSGTKVTGDDVPLPIGLFQDLESRFALHGRLKANLLAAEFVEPTPIQCEAIPATLAGRDIVACAPTGSGKTLAFLVPMVQSLALALGKDHKNSAVRGLVIAPTNELALQIHSQLQQLTRGLKQVPTALLLRQMATRLAQNTVAAGKYAVVVLTPLRLLDVVRNGHMSLAQVEQLVVDEADRLFDRGFVEQTDALLAECTHPQLRKLIYLATIPAGVEELANSIMRDPIRIIVGHKEAASSTIEQKVVFTGSEDGKLVAIRQMMAQGEFKPPVIIFLQLIPRAKALFHELLYDKLNVDVIHAERTPKQRDDVIKRFKNGDIWVLITTEVLARGVDFKGVNLVINYDVPQTAQAYVHRIGRTGRGGKVGRAVTFFTKEDVMAIKPIINVMKQSGSTGYSDWMNNMSKLSFDDKKKIRGEQADRKQISTVPKVVRQKRRQRQEMIEASKRRKAQEFKGFE